MALRLLSEWRSVNADTAAPPTTSSVAAVVTHAGTDASEGYSTVAGNSSTDAAGSLAAAVVANEVRPASDDISGVAPDLAASFSCGWRRCEYLTVNSAPSKKICVE